MSYQEKNQKSLSIRDIAVVSQTKDPVSFIENYKKIDSKELRKEFLKFPSFSILDSIYPESLKQIYNPPVLLFYQGNLDILELPKIAVVGSRDCSQEGTKVLEKIIKELGNQYIIVSGLARGIDTSAHMSSLKFGGSTIAVIGNGLDYFYPKENKVLQNYLSKNHLVLSEYGPNQSPLKFHFPERNRIIAGLSKGILIIEAKLRSGSLITCERGLEEGRDIFAVPGSTLSGYSEGCHQLIKEGAYCVTSGQDILLHYQC